MSHTNNLSKPFESDDELEGIARQFEACTLGADDFHHREHLIVILWYLSKLDVAEAASRMRESIDKFLKHHALDRQIYHETITLFWVKKVSALLKQSDKETSLAETANLVVEVCRNAKLINAYYSPELIASATAKAGWVEPDLQPLDF